MNGGFRSPDLLASRLVSPDGSVILRDEAWLPEEFETARGMSDVVTLEATRDVRCLFLLGEPGSGKSVALQQEADLMGLEASPGQHILLLDLGLAQDARELRSSLIEDPVFVHWRTGTERLYLYLDALDEAKFQIRKVVSLLERELTRIVHEPACGECFGSRCW